jgi:hypothetical protein
VRRTLPFVALWFVAGAAAAGIATAGVAVVNDQLTGSRPSPLSAAEVRQQAAAAEDAATTTSTGSTTSTTEPGGSTTTTTARPGAGTTGGTDGGPDPTATTTSASPTSVTRTYELVGGTATIRFSPSGITVLSATPKPGFAAEVEPEGTGMKVEFESEVHRSRIDAWWAGGPQTETREDDR